MNHARPMRAQLLEPLFMAVRADQGIRLPTVQVGILLHLVDGRFPIAHVQCPEMT